MRTVRLIMLTLPTKAPPIIGGWLSHKSCEDFPESPTVLISDLPRNLVERQGSGFQQIATFLYPQMLQVSEWRKRGGLVEP